MRKIYPDKKTASQAYYNRNRTRIQATVRAYRKANAVKINAGRRAAYASSEHKKQMAWSGNIRNKYGITSERYNEMLEAQGGACAVCRRPLTKAGATRLCVDHDHGTGRVRDLVCHRCNLAIGMVENDELHEAILAYITKHKEAS